MPAAETERKTEGTGDTWQQERQVRLTAQRILAEHLRDGKARDKRSTDSPGPLFWREIRRLNLAGATLIDFELHGGEVASANFGGAIFVGDADFAGATFTGVAEFSGATFRDGDAVFSRASFTGGVGFNKATFTDDAAFVAATFSRAARFDEATFGGNAAFNEATFRRDAGFRGATFSRSLSFERSRVVSPEAKHTWPKGWRLGPDGSGGDTVVRADHGQDTGL